MKTLVIVAHPQPSSSTTESFLKAAVKNEDNIVWHELHLPFNIEREQDLLQSAQRIIFQFPMYWYSAPAILKQWQDEVLTGSFIGKQLLKGKELGIVVTVAHSAAAFQPGASQQFTISELLRPYEALANSLTMKYLSPFPIYQFVRQTDEQRQLLFVRYRQYLTLPDFQRFTNQTKWFAEHLEEMIEQEKDPLKQAKLSQLLVLLMDQQDELDGLHTSLNCLNGGD